METIPAKTILSSFRQDSSWFGTNYTMNLYKGCSHACIYCDSRSECYRVPDFDRVRQKADAISILRHEMQKKRKKGVICTGSMSDPYHPREAELCLTRSALELADVHRFGISIMTKSDLIVRDIDLFQRIGRHSPMICLVTVTTVEDSLAAKIEPHAPLPSARFSALQALSDAGIYTGILLMPVLPFLEDTPENVLGIIERAKACGVKAIFPGFGVTLRDQQREYFYEKLDEEFPGLKQRYIRTFGEAYHCQSPNASVLYHQMEAECKKKGIHYRMEDIINSYQAGYGEEQVTFF